MLWELDRHQYPSLVLAFRHQFNYTVKYLESLAGRFGCSIDVFETGSQKKGATQLEKTLANGHPAIVWLDLGGAPFYEHFLQLGTAVVYGLEGDQVWVDHLAGKPYTLSRDQLAHARAKVPSYKNRIVTVHPEGKFDLKQGIRAGIQAQLDYLSASSTSFSLPSLRKWGRMITDQKNKKGWPTVFEGGRGFFGALRTIYEGIELAGTGGGAMRPMYADFLEEADQDGALQEAAAAYRALGDRWSSLAETVLPDSVDGFQATKALFSQRAAILKVKGSDALAEITPISDELHALKGEFNPQFPLNDSQTDTLMLDLQSQIGEIYQAEKAALDILRLGFDQLA